MAKTRSAKDMVHRTGANVVSATEHGRASRHRMRAVWDTVERMLTDPKSPRRDAQGRDVFEIWADLVLENPPMEFARVAREILPRDEAAPVDASTPSIVTNIQQLYLTAVQAANKEPDPRIVQGYAEGSPPVSDW